MIIVDTNVVAEAMKASPAPAVVSWLNAQETPALFLTAATLGGIAFTSPGGGRLAC
jgi:predicted nucleic acid-binding protein